jgi:methyl-accepting chemotaxis protein
MSDDYYTREDNISSLKFRLTLFFVFFFLAIIGVFIVTSVLQVNTVTRFIGSQLGIPAVQRVSGIIDGDRFEALSKSLDPGDPYYEGKRQEMLLIKEEFNVLYLYTMAPYTDTVYRFIIDGSAPPEDTENFSPLGSEEDISEYGSAFEDTMREKDIRVDRLEQNEDWGNIISVYAPILNSSGDSVGIIGCDLEADAIINWIRSQVLWQVAVVGAFVLLGLAVYLSLIRKINQID